MKLVQRAPITVGNKQLIAGFPTFGLWVTGQLASSGFPATFGSATTRGTHMGKPVAEAMVGLSWSTWNRGSGVCPRRSVPCRMRRLRPW